jgi:hypothetical protein
MRASVLLPGYENGNVQAYFMTPWYDPEGIPVYIGGAYPRLPVDQSD